MDLSLIAERLRNAQRVFVLTGAGVSAESGIPTFRDAQTGMWSRMRPEDLASPQAFARNPKLVWDWYAERRAAVRAAHPNPGHLALVTMASHVPQLTLATQNVDSLHLRAGSTNVLELHGSLERVRCSEEGLRIPEAEWAPAGEEGVPTCPECGALLRPDIVWFGEMLPVKALRAAQDAARAADVVLSIGTSMLVPPAASLPILAMEHGAFGIEVNREPTEYADAFDAGLYGPSGVSLPALVAAAWGTDPAEG